MENESPDKNNGQAMAEEGQASSAGLDTNQPTEEGRPVITELEQELNKVREESRKNYDLYVRALADAENARKRAQRDREEYIKYATLPLMKKLLPVIDDFQRAMQACHNSQDYEALHKGVEIILGHMDQILKSEGVEAIESLGKPFDPQLHQALMVEKTEEYEENTVIEELQKGYMLQNRVIRPSLVKVSG